jgi:hypothetical protein
VAQSWSGPAFAVLGAAVMGAIVLLPAATESPLAWWITSSALTPQRLLPLLGLGVALALVPLAAFVPGLALFCAGITVGFAGYQQLLDALLRLPYSAQHQFLTGPIAAIAVGLTLIAGKRLRPWVLPPAALIAGIMTAVAIVATDPSLNSSTIRYAGVLIAAWIIGAISLTLRSFQRGWFMIAGPILGSWLVAIGLLYGGSAMLPKRTASSLSMPPPSIMPPMEPLPGSRGSGIRPAPDGFDDPLRQRGGINAWPP